MAFFSIIIPSRNRPELLSCALRSVLDQHFDDFEVIVVDDGSQPPLQPEHLDLATHGDKVRIVSLGYQPRGRGPGYARNVGVWASAGKYCAFLDDDDTWVARDHLGNAYRALNGRESPADLYLSDQVAVAPGSGEEKRLWLNPLVKSLAAAQRPLVDGCYAVNVDDLLTARGFCHLNTTIVSRALFDELAGLDEYLGYEEDLDFFLRAIERADRILFCPDTVARHNIPANAGRASASNTLRQLQRQLIRLHLLDRNMVTTRDVGIQNYCRRYAGNTMKHVAEEFARSGQYRQASYFASRALGMQVGVKWSGYCLYLYSRSIFEREGAND